MKSSQCLWCCGDSFNAFFEEVLNDWWLTRFGERGFCSFLLGCTPFVLPVVSVGFVVLVFLLLPVCVFAGTGDTSPFFNVFFVVCLLYLSRLGTPHDGDGPVGWIYGSKGANDSDCAYRHGHIMSYAHVPENKNKFSRCSLREMKNFLRYVCHKQDRLNKDFVATQCATIRMRSSSGWKRKWKLKRKTTILFAQILEKMTTSLSDEICSSSLVPFYGISYKKCS